MEVKEKISAAKLWLQEYQPFFGYMALSHNFVEDSKKVETMAVDGFGNIYYNPNFIKKLKVKQIATVIAHELLHHIFRHVGRAKKMKAYPEVWNLAIDTVVNDILEHSYQGMEMPEGAIRTNMDRMLVIEAFPYRIMVKNVNKKGAERVYEEILKQLPKVGGGKGKGNIYKGFDKHINKGETDEQKVAQEVREAMEHARKRGKLSADMERLIKDWIESKINWKELLWKFVQSNIPIDFTYQKPSKKFYSTGIYLPRVVKENVEVIIALDTSGSISRKDFVEFKSEILALARSFKYVKFKLLLCDAKIKKTETITITNGNYEKIESIKQVGMGGTSHIPIIEHIKKKEPFAKCLVCFTDGYTEIHQEPPIPTIWILSSEGMDENEFKERFNIRKGIVIKIRR